jgi:hypothetical protein
MFIRKSFPVQERFVAEHKAEYEDFIEIAMRLQDSDKRAKVSAEDKAKAEAFRQLMVEAGCERASLQILDRAIF